MYASQTFIVNLRCTDSIVKMSFFKDGDRILELNSNSGRTYILKAEIKAVL